MKPSVLSVGLLCLFATACSNGSSSPSSPSAARPVAGGMSSVTMTAVTGATTSIFGASAADLARCLSGAGDAACFSGARPVVRVVTSGATAPGAPGTLTVTSSGSAVTLTWSAPTSGDPVVTYIIEAGSASGLSNAANLVTNSTATTFSTGGVPNGTYYVRIKAQNATGTSAASNEAILVVGPAACAGAPGAPTGLTSSLSGATVTLRWTSPSGGCAPTSYALQAGVTSGSSALANANLGNVTSYVATGVGAGTYYVRVVAMNANGSSIPSNEILLIVSGAGVDVSGRWIGVAPDGIIFDPESDLCDAQDDLRLDLTQTGSVLTGTLTATARAFKGVCSARNFVGTGVPAAISAGTVNGSTISFFLGGSSGGGATFSGTVSGTRLTGILIGSGDGSQVATFAVTRQ